MLFRFLGQVVRRGWPFLLAGWAALLLASWLAAPPWQEVAQDREFAFLPAKAPSRQAEEVYVKAFPTDRLASNIVLVLHRSGNEQPYLEGDLAFINTVLEPRCRKIAEREGGLAYEIKPSEEPLFGGESKPSPQPPERSIIARTRALPAASSGKRPRSMKQSAPSASLARRNAATVPAPSALTKPVPRRHTTGVRCARLTACFSASMTFDSSKCAPTMMRSCRSVASARTRLAALST